MRAARSLGVLALLLSGCAHGPLSPQAARRLHEVAIVPRVEAPPVAWVARGDRGLAPGGGARAYDAELEAAVARAVTGYELEEALRAAFTAELGAPPPWRLASPLDVASALGTLLAREREPDWSALVPLGVDGVFDLAVVGWGLWDAGPEAPTAGWMVVRARLLEPGSGRVLWSSEVRVNRSEAPAPGSTAVETGEGPPSPGAVRSALGEVVDAAAARLARDLGIARLRHALEGAPVAE